VTLDRALPSRTIDLIREGVSPADLRERGDQAVFSALVKTAMSACQRGWDCWEWVEVVHDARSHLGQQVRLKGGAKPRTAQAVAKTMDAAWEAATVKVSESPATGRDAALATAASLRDFVAEPDSPLADPQRAVLAHAAAMAMQYGTDRPALPRRGLQEATGLGLTTLRTVLRGLHDAGLLVLVDPGRSGGPNARKRRAALYRLPSPDALYLYRETRSVVPLAQVCGAPAPSGIGAPPQVCGAPLASPEIDSRAVQNDGSPAVLADPTTTPEEGTAMHSLTLLTAPAPEALAAVVAALRDQGIAVAGFSPATADSAEQPAEAPRLRVVGGTP
jgi:hypothetical protein